jgi:uncharacterized phiE125 gp8 family phage protein
MSNNRNRLLTRISAPASEPLTLAEAKLYLRVDHNNDDTLIGDLIVAARMIAESWLKRSLITQSWKIAYDDYVCERIPLHMGPVNSITSVVIVNRDGTTQAISSTTYYLNAARDTLIIDNVIFGFRIEISYATGYGAASAVPTPIKQGLLEHIAAMYDNRGEAGETSLPDQTVRLYMPFREIRL